MAHCFTAAARGGQNPRRFMIELRELRLAFGPRAIFDNVSAVVNKGDKIGLVGSNGAGKSTLLKILAGIESPDSGEVAKPGYATVGYLPQESLVAGSRPLYDEAESAFEGIVAMREKMARADAVIRSADPSSPEYADAVSEAGEIERRLEDAEESKLRSRVESVLMGLGFKISDMPRPCSEFSGGWQMRIALAKLLLREPSLLMLDEPTNHLDIESIEWLEDYLKSYPGAVLLVSHDRAFLNGLCNRTFHLSGGRLETYAGNYDFYEAESAARRLHLERAAENQRRAIEKTERFIERFRYKSSKAAQVQSRIKALGKIGSIELESGEKRIHFKFPEPERTGQIVLDVSGVCKSFGARKVLDGVSLRIERGERAALVGVNGAGKTTLAKIIAGAMKADSGRVELGLNVKMSYFAQHQTEELDKSNGVLEEALSAAPMERKGEVRGLLGSFLFTGDDVLKKVGVLSGGEKNRLALAKMLLRDFNFLLLDEPTNHLDMDSKKILADALAAYRGTYLIVSHDRAFLDPIVDKVYELGPSGLRAYPGNMTSYIEKIKAEGRLNLKNSPAAKKPASSFKERKAEAARRRAEISAIKKNVARLEGEIAAAEAELAKIEAEMAEPDFFKRGARCASAAEAYSALKSEIDALYSEWDRASALLEEPQSGG